MKQIVLVIIPAMMIIATGCSRRPAGLYVCEEGKARSTDSLNNACFIAAYHFKTGKTVTLLINGEQQATTYEVDNNYVRVKGTGPGILLKIKDDETLVAEGQRPATYRKPAEHAESWFNRTTTMYVVTTLFFAFMTISWLNWQSKRRRNKQRDRMEEQHQRTMERLREEDDSWIV